MAITFEEWHKQNEQRKIGAEQGPIQIPAMNIQDPGEPAPQMVERPITFEEWHSRNKKKPKGSIFQQIHGGHMRGWMRGGRAALTMPQRFMNQIGLLSKFFVAEEFAHAQKFGTKEEQDRIFQKLVNTEKFYDRTSLELGRAAEIQKKGQKAIERNHPEWETEPPKSFVDLISHPDKIAVSLAESVPVLLSAGVFSAAGRPDVGVMMMYASEGQEAYDQAIADGASKEDAEICYAVYGTVSAALENMQLQGILKIAKGNFNRILGRTSQKVARKGLKSLTYDTIKIAAQEALEEASQEAWQDATAKIVYDKSIPGGVAGAIDRYAQAALLGGLMGVIPGAGGAIAGTVTARTQQTVQPREEVAGIVEPIGEQKPEEIIAYHGTSQENLNKIKTEGFIPQIPDIPIPPNSIVGIKGIYLSQSEYGAKKFAKTYEKGSVIPVTVNLKNPFIIENLTTKIINDIESKYVWSKVKSASPQEMSQLVKEGLQAEGYDGIIIKKWQQRGAFGAKESQIIVFDSSSVGLKQKPEELTLEKGEEKVTEVGKQIERKKLTAKKALKLGHTYPKLLKWSEEQRRDFMQVATGKRSMKDMSLEQKRFYIQALREELKKEGIEYEEPESPVSRIIETLERTRKITEETPIKEIGRRGINRLRHDMKSKVFSFVSGLERIERFIEGLDGHEEGPMYKNIWQPIQKADEAAVVSTNNEIENFFNKLAEQDIDIAIFFGKYDKVPGTNFELTTFQRIGVARHSRNKQQLKYLIRGMGLTKEDIMAVDNSLTKQERNIANWLSEQLEINLPIILQAAKQAGFTDEQIEAVKKEYNYFPIIRTDVELEQQTDFFSELMDGIIGESYEPEAKFLEERKPKALGKIELDAGLIYLNYVARSQRFIHLAPVAVKVGKILNNKSFKRALNDRTYNQGNKILNTWMKDAVRGELNAPMTQLSRTITILRRNGIVYAIGYNIPSALRQALSGFITMAIDPGLQIEYPLAVMKASTPNGWKQIEDFVNSKTNLLQARDFDRDLRRRFSRKELRKGLAEQPFKRQMKNYIKDISEGNLQKLWLHYKFNRPLWSKQATSWIRWFDRRTTGCSWFAIYNRLGKLKTIKQYERYGISKSEAKEFIEKGLPEQRRIDLADKWTGRGQPMARPKDLPHFFRGGTLERLLTTFQNAVNQYGNFYAYDIFQARRYGKISNKMVAYRVMWSYVLPAIAIGMIGRGRPPKNWKEIAIDLAIYPVWSIPLGGRIVDRVLRGWGQSETIAEIGREEIVKTGRAIARGDVKKIIKHAAKAIGAITGRPTAQMIRTTEGVIDLAVGKTDDPRRLIYSEWALKQGEEKETDVSGW